MDREKVIEGLEKVWDAFNHMEHELYADYVFDAIALLKEQEAKKVTWWVGRAHCPSCGELFPKKQDKQYIRFCNYCGQAVKWE